MIICVLASTWRVMEAPSVAGTTTGLMTASTETPKRSRRTTEAAPTIILAGKWSGGLVHSMKPWVAIQ